MLNAGLKIRYSAEYLAARALIGLVDHCPLRLSTLLAHGVADCVYPVARTRRKIAVENIERSGLAATSAEARTLARASFRHFALLIVETLKSESIFTEANWRDRVSVEIPDETMAVLQDPEKGAILISGHLGNWELAAQLISFFKPVVGITRGMNNPYTNRLMEQRKPRHRFRLTPKHDADTGRFLSVIKNGEILALMIDQYARDRGMMIDFLGRPASTHTSPALLHLVTGAPLCFGYCVRTGPATYKLKAEKPVALPRTGNKEQDVRNILELSTRYLEQAIREYPAQYLWGHRRWR